LKRYLLAALLLPLLPLRLLWFGLQWLRLAFWRRRAMRPGRHYVLDWSGDIVETEHETRLAQWLRELFSPGEERVHLAEVRALRRSLELRAPSGLLIRLGSLSAGYAQCMELHAELTRIAKTTRVYVHLSSGAEGRELLVASAAHHVSAPPSVHISAIGSSTTAFFITRLLERIGLEAKVVSRGRYKSAVEPFTRTDRSEADREQATALVKGLDQALVTTLARRRNKSIAEIEEVMDHAPYSGVKAAEKQLIDASLREEELTAKIAADLGVSKLKLDRGDKLDRGGRLPRLRLLSARTREVGLVMVEGAIVDRRAPQQLSQATESEVIDDLRTALLDEDLAAVVLHINSPGGSVTASDAILAAVRRLDQEKPVVAYFSDVAASGGYYIACGARKIVASPKTITGSIGVFHVLPNLSALLARLEVGVDTIKQRRNADFASPFHPMSESQLDQLDLEVEEIYDRFLELVAGARRRTKAQIADVAEGRVWLGEDALRAGLIDELGGLEGAVSAARSLAQSECSEVPRLVHTKRRAQNRLPLAPASDPIALLLAQLGPLGRNETRLLREMWLLRETSHRPTWLYAPLLLR
jgi:protease-4